MYQGYLLPENAKQEDRILVGQDYAHMLVRVMQALVARFDAHYPFVDAKLSLLTGENFSIDDPVRGREAIYGWIQGRGLEALAGHCDWLQDKGYDTEVDSLTQMMRLVLARLRSMWQQNGERLWFFMLPDGRPFSLDAHGHPVVFALTADTPYGFSDLFASKGMYSAACYLNDDEAKQDALKYIDSVDRAIWNGKFENDQVTLDPKNPIVPAVGRVTHGPFMIQIGTAAMLVLQGDASGIDMGVRLIRHELNHYVNLAGRVAHLESGDMWEAVDADGKPYVETDGTILSDPGHALEFVGLALKFIEAAKSSGFLNEAHAGEIAQFEDVMFVILEQNFKNGFLGKGIVKAFDLVTRKPTNTDLPWWNLPETMRAAAFCKHNVRGSREKWVCDDVFRNCHNAFVRYFVRPDLHLMAYQTITKQGEPVDVIPATADADPGYHTGLSMIDVLRLL